MTDQPQHGDRVRITYDGTWWKSRSGITAVRTVHDGDDDWLTAVPDNASVQVLPTGPAATEATEPGRCCGKPAGAICVHDVTHLPTPERHAADKAAETVRVSLAELYGPMADLDHPQHPVNAAQPVEPLRVQLAEALDTAYSDNYRVGYGLPLEEMTDAALAVLDPHGDQVAALERGHRCLLENHDKRLRATTPPADQTTEK